MTATKLRPSNAGAGDNIRYTVAAETWRFIAYIFFWSMCAFAILFTKFYTAAKLAEGPTAYGLPEGDQCGPFGRSGWDGLEAGQGFEFGTQSHLQMLFGFKNICANWDYSPSRELTAMVYPLFEYSLLIYLILDFWTTKLANNRGELNDWFWKFSQAAFCINIVLAAQFRMIFVCIAYENVRAHTAGFLGLQVCLILVAAHNSMFLIDTDVSYEFLGGIKNTRTAIKAYLIGLLAISSVKVTATTFVVMHGVGAPWTLAPSFLPGKAVGQVVDIIWMLFNAVAPLFISYFRSHREIPIVIEISTSAPTYIDASGEYETLKKSGGNAYEATL